MWGVGNKLSLSLQKLVARSWGGGGGFPWEDEGLKKLAKQVYTNLIHRNHICISICIFVIGVNLKNVPEMLSWDMGREGK